MSANAPIREAATVALLRDGAAGLEVLLLQRHPGHAFGARAWVFPGGAVDAADADAALTARCDPASRAGAGLLAYRLAAIRESFEEAGVLVGCGCHKTPGEIAAARAALNAGQYDWSRTVARLDLYFRPDSLIYFAHFTTPAGPPKRYSTYFFAVAAPADQTPRCDGEETTRLAWVAPDAALAQAEHGRMTLMYPTRKTLECLRGYRDSRAGLAGLAGLAGRRPECP